MSSNIKVSLIIPTRERAETLKYTIETALNQQLQEYEVIVSDNFSQDHTKQVCESFIDSRLVYINTMQRLSMTDNFNFGVSHAKGEYIIIIGDDDGVMPNAIDKFCDLIINHPSELYTWPRHGYIWPSGDNEAELERVSKISSPVRINLSKQLRLMLKKGLCLNSAMPNTYHSATHRNVFDRIKLATGKYHQTTIPDEYMLFTLPIFCEDFVMLGEPLTVNGHSPKSNSGSLLSNKQKKETQGLKEIDKFINEQTNYKIHRSIPVCFPRTVSLLLDTFLVVRDMNDKYYSSFYINYSGMWAYGWLIYNLKNRFYPIKKRKELQLHEAFNPFVYLTFSILFFGYVRFVKKLLIKSKTEKLLSKKFKENPSQNIIEFVNFINKNG